MTSKNDVITLPKLDQFLEMVFKNDVITTYVTALRDEFHDVGKK